MASLPPVPQRHGDGFFKVEVAVLIRGACAVRAVVGRLSDQWHRRRVREDVETDV